MKNKNIIYTASFLLIVLVAIYLGGKYYQNSLSEKLDRPLVHSNGVPAPYNQFDYFYVSYDYPVSYYSSFKNGELIDKTDSVDKDFGILQDGNGFYKIKFRGNESIQCGEGVLEKSNDTVLGSNQFGNGECITLNGHEYLVKGDPLYIDSNTIVYQQCESMKFYTQTALTGTGLIDNGMNGCAKYNLKINDKLIDQSEEGHETAFDGKTRVVLPALGFDNVNFLPGQISYIKMVRNGDNEFWSYDFSNGQKKKMGH